jgi:hypothetical protein
MQAYPKAKVLLTVRDPQSWYESTKNTIYQVGRMIPDSPATAGQRRMVNTLVWQGTFGGAFEEKQRAISIFERHIQEVKDRVAAERLLVYDVKQGWEPLCRFLHVAVPADTPFPHLNDTGAFHQMIQERIQTSKDKDV